MNFKYQAKRVSFTFLLLGATAVAATAQSFATLADFNGANGTNPVMSLIQGPDGGLYGTTQLGGANASYGTIFEVTPTGTLDTLYSFCIENQFGCPDGNWPFGGLVEASDGNFYGTTAFGGSHGAGTIFKVAPGGTPVTLYNFCSQSNCIDGSYPYAGLIEASGGELFGTTYGGGAFSYGTVFKITSTGVLTTMHSFNGKDGEYPFSGLIQATNGNFYGTTSAGGSAYPARANGTVFKMTVYGVLTTLHSFNLTDGSYPYGGLVYANGNFYGTTNLGGSTDLGTVFKITPDGALTSLHSFDGVSGSKPYGGLIRGTDGNLYGTTYGGGSSNCGTVFRITPSGTLTTLHSFNGTDGSGPQGGLLQATDGNFYGTTLEGGLYGPPSGYGTVFAVSVGLRPFIKFFPTSGQAWSVVRILGTNLTGATSVTFNGVPAKFQIVSATEISALAPDGVTTGRVQVTIPKGVLSSAAAFVVQP